mgnify:CR=1 FL=1
MRPRSLFIVTLVAAGLLNPTVAWARRAGAPAARNGSAASGGLTCSACHSNSTGFTTGGVQILNAPPRYNLNRTYNIGVLVQDTVQLGGGFEFSAESTAGDALGQLILSDTVNTRFAGSNPAYVTHTSTGVSSGIVGWAASGNAATFNLQWKAPAVAAGTVSFYAAGLAINNNNSSSLDHLYLANQTAVPASCIKADANNDSFVDGRDIEAFTAALLDPSTATPEAFCASDMDDDGALSDTDTAAFVNTLLAAGG